MAKSKGPSGGGGSVDQRAWVMPRPGALVVWRNAAGGDSCFAVVTYIGRNALNIMLFPPDSKFGIPKDSVRHVDDPWNKVHGVNADSGVWEHTDEHKLLVALAQSIDENAPADGPLRLTDAAVSLLGKFV